MLNIQQLKAKWEKEKNIEDDGYCDDCTMCWVAKFLEANDGKAPAPAELAAFIKSKNHYPPTGGEGGRI